MAIVNYEILNIGELLNLLPCNLLRNNVRTIEKLNKRFINAKYGKKFNETYIYIYIYIISNAIILINVTFMFYLLQLFYIFC